MHLEVIRMLVDALNDPATGVGVQLETVPRDAEDANITIIAPSAVLDPSRNDQTALGGPQLDFPVLVVSADEPATADGETHTLNVHHRQSDSMPISVRLVTREADSADAVRDALYTERAIIRAIRQWLLIDADNAKRKRNGVSVITCERLTYAPVDELVGKPEDPLQVLLAIRLDLTVRDLLP